jgi:hypothetical protein
LVLWLHMQAFYSTWRVRERKSWPMGLFLKTIKPKKRVNLLDGENLIRLGRLNSSAVRDWSPKIPEPIQRQTTEPPTPRPNFFIYLICHDFRKIIGRIKIFDKCTSDAVAHSVRLLPPCRTVLSPCRRGLQWQESISCASGISTASGTCRRAARRQVLNAVPHCGWIFFSFCIFSLKRPNINCKHNHKGIL